MFPRLSTNRLILQQIQPKDQQFIFEGLSHPAVIPFYGVRYDSYEATGAQMEWYDKMFIEGTGMAWKIVDRQTASDMGVISVYFYKAEHNKAEIGFWLLPSFWNQGYAREAMVAVVEYWQKERNLHRLEAFVEVGNEASSKLLENTGFRYEGTMKDCELKNGRYISLHIYALIAS